jgi:predicted GTPase
MPGNLVAVRKSMLAWDSAKKKAKADLAGLTSKIAKAVPNAASEVANLTAGLGRLDAGLESALNAVVNAKTDKERSELSKKAVTLLKQYQDHLRTNKLLAAVEANPLSPLKLRENLSKSLTALAKDLGS